MSCGDLLLRRSDAYHYRTHLIFQNLQPVHGATLSRTWKLPAGNDEEHLPYKLQWGHAQPNVETRRSQTTHTAEPGFNGATLSRTWKPFALTPQGEIGSSFNGATLSRTWKLEPSSSASLPFMCFNGATLSRTWKPARRRNHRPRGRRFNGATLSRTWKRPSGDDKQGQQAGFNGATLSRTWKPLAGEPEFQFQTVLQWGHAQPNVETTGWQRR